MWYTNIEEERYKEKDGTNSSLNSAAQKSLVSDCLSNKPKT